jgi:uncharacterized protein (DUF433 family)
MAVRHIRSHGGQVPVQRRPSYAQATTTINEESSRVAPEPRITRATDDRACGDAGPPRRGAIGFLLILPPEPAMADPIEPAVHSDPEILGGTPVFVGTRVPVRALIDYLEAGRALGEFLEDFPTVRRDQAVAVLEEAKELLVAGAPASR